MAKQINIDLVFNANTSQAKSQMVSLQNQLNQLQNTTVKSISAEGLTSELSKASNVLISLKTNLNSAFNVDTGKLDLGKFSTNLKNSNMTLKDYRKSLEQLGPAGQSAFNQLTQSVINGQMPLKQTKNLLTSMMNTFGSSIKWTIAYGTIEGIKESFQDAFEYAQDLNESLTNIGVVASKSTDEMKRFAEQANKAAKSLSSTTTAYTDAALIYYQQGLSDEEVKKRTDVTIKMANVTGQSAQQTSEQLTAIWNNFDDGSKKLEYYADVMTKLGAETASSADEIATGFEKFAAVADTVGLSYERGAAAIATVTATTRQSADVVGTAFKTLFARVQDLELGNTLDDGTTLGSYSEALNKVGINIKTTSGDLKEMDDILAEMGSAWKTLSNDEQVALAKSVAGIRQYTQLIALMDNYDYFEQLTSSAEQAEGTLEQQQARWAESWEAAQNRVKASSEDLYNSLINDEFFIDLNNLWADLISGIDKLFDSMGGLRTLLPFILGMFTKMFGPTAISMIGSFVTNLKGVSTEAQNTALGMRKAALEENALMARNEGGQASTVAADAYQKELEFITQIEKIQRNLNAKEVEELQVLVDQVKMRRQYLVLLGEAADKASLNADKQREENKKNKVDRKVDIINANESTNTLMDYAAGDLALEAQVTKAKNNIAQAGKDQNKVNELIEQDFQINKNGRINSTGVEQVKSLGQNENIMSQLDLGTQKLINNFSGDTAQLEKIKEALKELTLEVNAAKEAEQQLSEAFKNVEGADAAVQDFVKKNEKLAKTRNKVATGERNLIKLNKQSEKATDAVSDAVKEQNEQMDQAINDAKKMQKVPLGNTLTEAAGSASMLAGGLSSIVGAGESVINMFETGEHTIGGWVSAISSIAMGIGMLIPGFTGLTSAISGTTLANSMAAFSSTALITALDGQNASTKLLTISKNKEQLAKLMGITAEQAEALIKAKNTGLTWAEAAAEVGITTAKGGSTAATIAQTIANWALNASMSPVLVVTLLIIAAFAILIGVIAGVVAIIGAISDAWNADAIAAEKANQKLAEAKELANEAKEAYDNLKKSIEDYHNTQKAIETMVEGTKEWKEAIREANQQVLELMTQYPELAKYVSNTNGRLQINEKGFDEILNVQAEKLAKAQALVNIRQITANNANAEDKQTQFARNNSGVSEVQLEQLQKLYNNQDFETYNKNLQNLIGSDKELGNQINSLIKSQNDLIIANDNLQESIIQSVSQNNEEYNSSQYKGYIDYFAGRQLETDSKLYQEKEAEVEELFSGSNDDFWKAYLEEVLGDTNIDEGSTTGDNYRVKDLGGDYVTLQKRNAEGVFETVGEEEGLEEAKAKQEVVNIRIAEETKKLYGEYEKSAEKIETALKDAGIVQRANEAASTYQNRLSEIGMQFAEGKELDLSNLTWSEVEDLKNNISNINSVTNDFKQELSDQLSTAVEEYAKQRAERNLEASSEWLKNKEEREAEELSKILSEAEMDKTDFENYTKQFAAYGDQADDIAKQVLKTSNAIFKLNEAFKNNDEILAGGEGTAAYATAIGDIQTALKDWLGTDLDYEYVTKNLDKIKLAAEGDTKALKELQIEAARKIVVDMDIPEEDSMKLTNFIDDISKKEIKFGASIDDTEFINTLNEMLKNGQITAEQASAYLNSIGYSPDIDYTTIEQSTEHKYKIKLPLIGTEVEGSYWTYEDLKIPVINAKGTTYTGPKTTTTPASVGSKESKSENKARKRDLDNEIERYHEIDEAIENTERELDKLAKAKDRAFGKDKLALMDMEIQKNKELLAEEQERIRQAEEYYQQDRKQLLDNYAVNLDSEGNITNYNDIIESITSKLKGMDPDTDAYSQTEDYLSNFKDDAAKYEESLDAVNEGQQKVIDLQYELADLAMEKIEYKVSFKVEMAEDDMAYIDFLMSKIEDDAFAVAEKVKLQSDAVGVITEQIAATEQGISGIMAEVNKQGFMTEAQAEQLREYRDNLTDYEAQLREIKTTVEESLTEAYDAWNEKLDENIDKFNHFDSVIESYRNIIDIVGKDTLGISNDIIKQMNQIQVENSNNTLKSSKDILDARKAVLEDYKSKLAAATTDEDRKYWEEQIQIAEEQVREATESFMSNWENALTVAAEAFKQNVEIIVEEFEKSISGIYGSLDKLSDAFDKQKEISERYLADYEKTYELSKLNRQIEQSIDKTDNLANQKALRGLQADLLAMQEEGVNVSERDIGYMQKRYELMLAEQVLRDAQNAKSVVRLQRDSEGNFGYVYTADQSAVDSAEQTYEDKLYDLQKYQEESMLAISEGYLAAQQGFADAILSLTEANASGNADIIAEAQRNYDYWSGQMEYYYNEMQKGFDFGKLINEEYNTDLQTKFNDTIYGHLFPDQDSWELHHNSAQSSMKLALDDYIKALDGEEETSYKNTVKRVFEAADSNVKDFKDHLVDNYLPAVQGESDDTADATETMAGDMKTAMGQASGYVSDFQKVFSGRLKTIQNDISATITSVNELIKKFADMITQANTAKTAMETASGRNGSSSGGENLGSDYTNTDRQNFEDLDTDKPPSKNASNGSKMIKAGDGKGKGITFEVTNKMIEKAKANPNTVQSGSRYNYFYDGTNMYYQAYNDKAAQERGYVHWYKDGTLKFNWNNIFSGIVFDVAPGADYYKLEKYDTGGYTGSWGPEGRMAMLHQKEMVLNAQDTENFLAAIKIVRSMADQIETNALMNRYSLSSYAAATIKPQGDTLEQNITIHAEFPNATDHNEIEQAFRDLNNLASQYANRKI